MNRSTRSIPLGGTHVRPPERVFVRSTAERVFVRSTAERVFVRSTAP